MSTYDEWKSTQPDPFEDEERPAEGDDRDDEPDYDAIDRLDWSDLNDEASNINIVTGEVEE